jgi:hypothetical protein
MAPGSKFALAPARLPIAILTALLLVIAAAFRPTEEREFVTNGVTCLRTGLTFSIPAGILFGLIVRRGAMLSPKLIGATAGALSGLAGLTVLEVNCSNLNVFHILVWHWGVILIGPGCGALFGAAVEHIERRRLD